MIKRLEQVAALVVAAGLAIVSYWLFFSWAQGGGADQRQRRSLQPPCTQCSQAAAGLEQPLLAGGIVQGGQVGPHLVAAHGHPQLLAEGHDALKRA